MKKFRRAISVLLITTLIGSNTSIYAKEIGDSEKETVKNDMIVSEASEETYEIFDVYDIKEEIYEADKYLSTPEYTWETEVKGRIQSTIDNYESKVALDDLGIVAGTSTQTAIDSLVKEVLAANPLFCYNTGRYGIATVTSAGIAKIAYVKIEYSDEYLNADETVNKAKIEAKKAQIESKINEILNLVNDDMSDVEKALMIHDYLVRECDYDYENYVKYQNGLGDIPRDSFTIVGVLFNGVAVCQGYADLYNILMERLGIEGRTVSSEAMWHEWNIVKLDGKWYHIDVTWDDLVMNDLIYKDSIIEGYVSHDFFLKSDYEMTSNTLNPHYGWTDDTPKCNDSGSYSGYIFRDYSETAFNYDNGSWYFASGNKIYKADINGNNAKVVKTVSNPLVGAFIYDKSMYYADAGAVYKINVKNISTATGEVFYNFASENKGYTLCEFAIKNKKLVANGYKKNTDSSYSYVEKLLDLPKDSDENFVYGDANGDGIVDTSDSVLIKKYLAGYSLDINEDACDVDGDGDITSADAVLVLKKLAGYNVTLGN